MSDQLKICMSVEPGRMYKFDDTNDTFNAGHPLFEDYDLEFVLTHFIDKIEAKMSLYKVAKKTIGFTEYRTESGWWSYISSFEELFEVYTIDQYRIWNDVCSQLENQLARRGSLI